MRDPAVAEEGDFERMLGGDKEDDFAAVR